MKRVCLLVVVALGLCLGLGGSSLQASESVFLAANTPAVSAPYATGNLAQSVYALPDDAGKLYLSVVGSKNDPQFKKLCETFRTQPGYAELRASTHYNELSKESKMYQGRYAQAADFRDLPCVQVRSIDGSKLCEYSGRNIPKPNDLVAHVNAQCLRKFREMREQKQPVDDRDDKDLLATPADDYMSLGMAVLAIGVGVAWGCYDEFLKRWRL